MSAVLPLHMAAEVYCMTFMPTITGAELCKIIFICKWKRYEKDQSVTAEKGIT